MAEINSYVREYLEYYCSFPYPQQYAVLINGPWGSGKTHVVKRFLNESNIKHLYISLYGVNDFKQIEDSFFQQLHPLLASKGMRIVSAVAKGLLKTAVKIDLDRDGNSDGSVTSQMPDINLPSYLSDAKDRVLVFDDLERCKIPVTDVLGYINSFVEHDDAKAIIIANEQGITKDQVEAYRLTKEKVIGTTLDVRAEFETALAHFNVLIDDKFAHEFFKTKTDDFRILFEQSETHNLRLLQQAMWHFQRFLKTFSDKHRMHTEAITSIFKLFFALSFELKSGRLTETQIAELDGNYWLSVLRDKNSLEPSTFEKLEQRYSGVQFNSNLLSYKILSDIIARNVSDSVAIQKFLDQHPLFSNPQSEPSWRVLWYAMTRSEKEIAEAMIRFESDFLSNVFRSRGEILHVAGIRLWFGRIGALGKNPSEVAEEMMAYIDGLYDDNKLEPNAERGIGVWDDNWDGLAFWEKETDEFRRISSHLGERQQQVLLESYPAKAVALMEEMQSDVDLFFKRLCLTNSEENLYYRVPILALIEPKDFVFRFLALERKFQREVLMVFKPRYEHPNIRADLKPEHPWLVNVQQLLLEEASHMSAIPRYSIESWVARYLEPAINCFQS